MSEILNSSHPYMNYYLALAYNAEKRVKGYNIVIDNRFQEVSHQNCDFS